MLRAFILVLLFSPAAFGAPLPGFDVVRDFGRPIELFSAGAEFTLAQAAPSTPPGATPKPSTDVARPDNLGSRQINNWYGRGFGISIVATAAIAYPGAGIGLEVSLPLDAHVGLVLRGGIIGNLFFEGSYYDLGPRGYFDVKANFTLYVDGGLRIVYGRILGYVGNSLDHALHRLGVGGFSDLGLEVGSPKIRFFAEVTLNGAKTLGEEFQVMIFCGLNVGLRIYIGG